MSTFPSPIVSRLPEVGTTIFTVMSALANEYGAINLSQGFPDFDCPALLLDRVIHHMKAGHNQYAPMTGVAPLREAIAEKVKNLYGHTYDPQNEITVTAGATQAIYTAVAAMVHPGDEVIVFEPVYDSYVPAIQLAGGKPVYVRLKFPDYHIDWEEVAALVSPRTRMIMINTPHNPTGSVFSAADMEALIKIVAGTDIVIVSDEVYEHIVFDGLRHESVARYPELAERSFIISSFGKTYHVTGWKIGYCLAPKELMVEFRKAHQFIVFTCNTAVQFGLADFMQEKSHYLELSAFYQQKRDFFLKAIKGSRFTPLPSSGTYFQLLRYDEITEESDADFAKRMTRDAGVASIPISAFYRDREDNQVVRFCFAKGEKTLLEGAARLCQI
ncbi:MAG: pyridoxal phosphate-dependent aminotransferase [Pseudomonadota bacterium]